MSFTAPPDPLALRLAAADAALAGVEAAAEALSGTLLAAAGVEGLAGALGRAGALLGAASGKLPQAASATSRPAGRTKVCNRVRVITSESRDRYP
jgi:hypothetical protein